MGNHSTQPGDVSNHVEAVDNPMSSVDGGETSLDLQLTACDAIDNPSVVVFPPNCGGGLQT